MPIAQSGTNDGTTIQPASFDWTDSPSVQKLLDVVASIIADEYTHIARQNPDVFSDNGGKR